MLRITASKANADQVKKYFNHPNSQEAYYSEGQDFNGIWGGKGAARLGLSGSLQDKAFARLCDNFHPLTGEQLTQRMKSNRRVGYDVNFHVPKSVSLAYFYSKDERVLHALRQAANDTLEDMERMAGARVRKGGVEDSDRRTGELVWAEFVHMTSRPVGRIPDPHLHVHCYVFNATYDKAEGQWKALQFGDVMDDADGFQKAFLARLATNLKHLGLEIENNDVAFEIAGVSRDLIKKFSRRTEAINAEAARRGITDAKEKDKLGALTRERKIDDVPLSELEEIWWERLAPNEQRALESIKATLERTAEVEAPRERPSRLLGTKRAILDSRGRAVSRNRATWPMLQKRASGPVEPTEHDFRAVEFAVEHLFERTSMVREKQLVAEAFKSWSYGLATIEGVEKVIRDWPFLRAVQGNTVLLTTQEVLNEEERTIAKCKGGRGQFPQINPSWKIKDKRLNKGQREAVSHVLASTDFVVGISGKAGTGKTTLLHEAKKGIEAGGNQLWVFAPTAEAARDTLRNEGFSQAETVALLLCSEKLQEKAAGAVWWVDEAGLLSSRTMDKLLTLAEKLDSRVILVGDTGQHQPVERGQGFRLLEEFGGMSVAIVSEVLRQKGEYKAAVELISAHDYTAGFTALEKMGAIKEITNQSDREKELAKDYVALGGPKARIQVVCPTHQEGGCVTQAIRDALKESGSLHGGSDWLVHRNLSWTDAEKRDARHYRKGLVVQVNLPTKGYAVGEQLEVVSVSNGQVLGKYGCGEFKQIPLSHPDNFNVYDPKTIEVCEGDKIRITANGRSADRHPLYNGSCYTVRKITRDGEIVLNNGWRLGKDFTHFDYGYVTTSHVAQSKTVDYVLVVQSARLSAGATDSNQFYVSISRGQRGVRVYTDNLELLRENAARLKARTLAVEVLQTQKGATNIKPHTDISASLGTTPAPDAFKHVTLMELNEVIQKTNHADLSINSPTHSEPTVTVDLEQDRDAAELPEAELELELD